MPIIQGHAIDLCYEENGPADGAPLVLIHGIGCQLVQWPSAFVDALAGRGFRVLRLDNRDMGRSGWLTEAGPADLAATMAAMASGDTVSSAYTLSDMAADVIALLDRLEITTAHIVGVSMGGMIAQHLAFEHPRRVRSLTSIMSSTGNPALPPPTDEAAAVLVTPPPANDRDSLVEHSRRMWDAIAGPHYPSREAGIGQLAEVAVDRAQNPAGFTRQLAAIVADGSRVERLRGVEVPTLVIHGDIDPLVPPAAGEDTAAAIPGARLELIPKMGHDLPEPLIPQVVTLIADHAVAADAGGTG